ncbi:MAG: hypothetical protein J6U01_09460 [Clostridia bacterium]|nr:hypothetical protein [Clostridia bacterium]
MDQLITVKAMKERYGCSNPTARKYLRQCEPHMENPLCAPLWAVQDWEDRRTAIPASVQKERRNKRKTGRIIVPRKW